MKNTKDSKFDNTRTKIIDILKNYHEIKNKIKALQSQIAVYKEMLQSVDLIESFEIKTSSGFYNNDSVVEKEMLFNLSIEKRTQEKIMLIKKDIKKFELEVNINKAIISTVNTTLNSLHKHDKELIILFYIDRKRNNDKFLDVCNKYNQGKQYLLSVSRIQQKVLEITNAIALKLMNIQILELYKGDY